MIPVGGKTSGTIKLKTMQKTTKMNSINVSNKATLIPRQTFLTNPPQVKGGKEIP